MIAIGNLKSAIGPIVAAAAVAASSFGMLYAVAAAPDAGERKATIARLEAEAAGLPQPTVSDSPYPPGAVCASGLAPAQALLAIRIRDAAAAAGLSVDALEMGSETAPEGQRLSRVKFSIAVSGPYASGVTFAKNLADGAPTLFVDDLRLEPGPDQTADWRIVGKTYCAIRLTP